MNQLFSLILLTLFSFSLTFTEPQQSSFTFKEERKTWVISDKPLGAVNFDVVVYGATPGSQSPSIPFVSHLE